MRTNIIALSPSVSCCAASCRLLRTAGQGQLQGADGDGVFGQRGEGEAGAGVEDFHDEWAEGGGDGGSKRFADAGKAAANDDDLWMKEVNDMRKTKCQVFGGFLENSPGGGVVLLEGGAEVSGFAAGLPAGQFAKKAGGVAGFERADFGIDGPAGAAGFEDGSLAIQSRVADFGFAGRCAVVNATFQDESATDAAAECDVENRVGILACAVKRLAERGHIGVVVHEYGRVDESAQPATEIEFRPAFDLMRAANLSGAPIHRSAETDAGGHGFGGRHDLFEGGFQLTADAGGALGGINGEAVALEDVSGGIAHDDLQLGAADFDAEKGWVHGVFSHRLNTDQTRIKAGAERRIEVLFLDQINSDGQLTSAKKVSLIRPSHDSRPSVHATVERGTEKGMQSCRVTFLAMSGHELIPVK